MVLCGGKHFANIDFGWMEEAPSIDTDDFPIPPLLKEMLKKTKTWSEFCDLCWDALHVLHVNKDEVVNTWRRHLAKVEPPLTVPYYHDELTANMVERMQSKSRLDLDKELDTKYFFSKTQKKDVAHQLGNWVKASSSPKPAQETSTDTPSPATRATTPQRDADGLTQEGTLGSVVAESSAADRSEICALKEEVTELKTGLLAVKDDLAEMKGMMQEMLLLIKNPPRGPVEPRPQDGTKPVEPEPQLKP